MPAIVFSLRDKVVSAGIVGATSAAPTVEQWPFPTPSP